MSFLSEYIFIEITFNPYKDLKLEFLKTAMWVLPAPYGKIFLIHGTHKIHKKRMK